MTRKQKKERERLRKQVELCRRFALDHYLAGNAEKEAYWEQEAIKAHHEVMMLYPRYRNNEKIEKRRVYVAVMPQLPAKAV